MKEKNNRPDGKTIELVRRGIINLDTGKISRAKAIKAGIPLPPKNKGKQK